MRRTRSTPFRLALVGLVTGLLAVAPAAPASAHSDDGEMTVLEAEAVDADTVRLVVGILYANDRDLAEEAETTATLTGPDGATVGPVPLPREDDARYAAEVDVPAPGAWEVALSSTNPDAAAAATVEVQPAPTTTTSTTATTATTTTSDDAGSTPEARAAREEAEEREADDVDGPAVAVLAVGAVAALAAAALLALFIVRRNRSRR